MQLMGEKTGAFTTTISGDVSVLQADNLKQYDAVYLNNNVGTQVDVFGTPELRQGFLDYVSNGGGLVASHGTSVASPNWKEFGELLGATGASHRESDEKAIVHVEDPNHPITRAFGGKSFELIDEFYRFQAPFSRERLRVLLTVDPPRSTSNRVAATAAVSATTTITPSPGFASTARVASSITRWVTTRICSGIRACSRCSSPVLGTRSAIWMPTPRRSLATHAGSTKAKGSGGSNGAMPPTYPPPHPQLHVMRNSGSTHHNPPQPPFLRKIRKEARGQYETLLHLRLITIVGMICVSFNLSLRGQQPQAQPDPAPQTGRGGGPQCQQRSRRGCFQDQLGVPWRRAGAQCAGPSCSSADVS